jgi:hypothetical protein
MKNFIYTLLIFLSILVLHSCGKKLLGEYYLSEESKNDIPFNGYESITFTDNNNNPIIFKGGIRNNRVTESDECINCSDYYIFEREWINFSDGNDNDFTLQISSGIEENDFLFGINIGGNGFICNLISPLSKETLKHDDMFYDSLVISNKTYHNVFSDTLTHIGSIGIDPYPVRCYYSTEFGIVKISFSDSTSWELKNIEW